MPLADAVGATGQLIAVESDRRATEHLRDNLAAHPWALVVPGRVDDLLGVPRQGRRRGQRRPARSDLLPPSAHVVVLDPPRTGAGPEGAGVAPVRTSPARTSPVALVVAWAIVGVPAAWGLLQTAIKSLALFK